MNKTKRKVQANSFMATLQVSKAPPDLCRRMPNCLLQNNAPVSQASNPSQRALPFPSHLAWHVRPTTPPNHLVNVEKAKTEWFPLRSNVGGHQDSGFISRKSFTVGQSLTSCFCSTGTGSNHATAPKPPAPDDYFHSVLSDLQSFCCAICDYNII